MNFLEKLKSNLSNNNSSGGESTGSGYHSKSKTSSMKTANQDIPNDESKREEDDDDDIFSRSTSVVDKRDSILIEDYEGEETEEGGLRSQVPKSLEQLENKAEEEKDTKEESKSGAEVRKYHQEDISHPNWPLHQKHFFVLSSAGKPIYSRYGDEQNLSSFMASLTAIVSFVIDLKDNIRYITAGKHKFVFLDKKHLILVAASRTSEPVTTILNQLTYLYTQIISILTGSVHQIFDKRPHFDLRNLFGGGTRYLDTLVHVLDRDPSFLLGGVQALRIDSTLRQSVATAIQSAAHPDLLYGLLISDYRLISLVRPKKYALQPSDLHLLMNFVNSSTALTGQASWCPVCLPKFNDQGFLHVYIQTIEPGITLLLISLKQEGFFDMHKCAEKIGSTLEKSGSSLSNEPPIAVLKKAVSSRGYSVEELGVKGLLHFLYKSKVVTQVTYPVVGSPYNNQKDRKRLFRLYESVHKRLFEFKNTHKLYYQVTSSETVICWANSGRFELYAVFGPLTPKSDCIRASKEILRWIKAEETSLFIFNAPVW